MQNDVDLQVLKVVVSKLDETLDRISESTNSISKLLNAHDGRIDRLEKDTDDNHQELRELYTRMEKQTREILREIREVESRIEHQLDESSEQSTVQHRSLTEKVDKLDERMKQLEQWRWYIAGAFGLILFIITNSESVIKILK